MAESLGTDFWDTKLVDMTSQCVKCQWDRVGTFSADEVNGDLRLVIGQFLIILTATDEMKKSVWRIRDLNSHTSEPNKKIHSTYHFEVTCDPPIDPTKVKGFLQIGLADPKVAKGGNPCTKLRVHANSTDRNKLGIFQSWVNSIERVYDFRLTHEMFLVGDKRLQTTRFGGIAFTLQNCHVQEGSKDPDWRLITDMGDYINTVVPGKFKGLERSPIRADYGVGLESWQRAQGAPFWEMYRKGKITRNPDKGKYKYRGRAEYLKLGGIGKLRRRGGSWAYKGIGKFISNNPNKPIESNRRMRIGTIMEEVVMLTTLVNSEDGMKVHERGWIDYPTPTKAEEMDGLSPDGIITDPTVLLSNVTKRRIEEWTTRGDILDIENNTINGASFSKGLLEIKVSECDENMRDYYRIQCIWAMKILNVYWAKLVKLHTKGDCRSYLMYRDFDKEEELTALLANTQARVCPTLSLVQSMKNPENVAWLRKMWGSATWFNEHKDLSSVTLDWKGPETSNYFGYLNNARIEISRSWEEVEQDTEPVNLFPPLQDTRTGNSLEKKLKEIVQAHETLIDKLNNPMNTSNKSVSEIIEYNSDKLKELMGLILSEKKEIKKK